tara:strand:+ start:118 stop:336 length:219 start_codon:yes stop_codon:yes gene_type:complete
MVNDINDDFLDEIDSNDDSTSNEINNDNIESDTLANKKALEQAQKNLLARKRIDELKEKKRLKDLLDDSEDW